MSIDSLRHQVAVKHHKAVYAILWAAHCDGSEWVGLEVLTATMAEQGHAVDKLDVLACLQYLQVRDYVAPSRKSGRTSRTSYRVSAKAVRLGCSEVGEPLSADYRGLKVVTVPRAIANDPRMARVPLEQLQKYAG